jgi:capsular exopolysaccharide synthesis family protein
MEERGITQFVGLKPQQNGNLNYLQPLPSQFPVEEEEEINLRQLLAVVKHRLGLILLVATGITTAIGVWTFYKPPIYEGKFQMLVGKPIDETKSGNIGNADILNQLGVSTAEIDYKTQIEVLRSPSILNPVLAKLTPKYPDLNYEELIPKKGKAPLEISQIKETKILDISFRDQEPEKIKTVLDNLAKTYLKYSLEDRKIEINQGLEFVENQLPSLRKQVNTLQEKLQKFRQRYKFLDPQAQAEQLAEQLKELEGNYVETQVKLQETNSLYAILQQQVGLDPDRAIAASYLSESPRYQKLLEELQEVEVELAKQSALFSAENPIIQTLQDKRKNLLPLLEQEAQKALGNRYSSSVSNSPSLASPSKLRLDLNQQFVQAANERQVLEIRRQALQGAIQNLKLSIKQMPFLARQYTDLQTELKVANDSLNRFLEAQQKLELDAAQKTVPWRIISAPKVEEDPVSPKPVRNLALGAIGGLLLGLGAALLAERLDPVFHSSEDLKEDSQLPVLGVIPMQKDLNSIEKVVAASLPQLKIGDRTITIGTGSSNPDSSKSARSGYRFSGFAEAFHALNTNIRLLGSDSLLNSLVISSATPGDGKSTISINLAQAAATMGQRVLLVDADLRRPQIAQRLGLAAEPGLSNVIATGLALEEAIQVVPGWTNLSILGAGELPPDPVRLLASKRMQDVMEQLQERDWFDLVIYDTPPIGGFADGKILAALTTGIILVARMGKTDRFALKRTLEELKLSQVSVLGVVANGVKGRGSGSSYYYSNYYSQKKR